MSGGGFLGVAEGNWGRPGTPQQHRQPLADPPSPDSTHPNISAFSYVTFTSLRLNFYEVTKLRNQLSAAQEQLKGPCSILQGASVNLHTILLGVGGTIYNNYTLKPFKESSLDSQRVKKLASKLHVHQWFCQLRCQTCPYQTCPFQPNYQLSSGADSGQACNPL